MDRSPNSEPLDERNLPFGQEKMECTSMKTLLSLGGCTSQSLLGRGDSSFETATQLKVSNKSQQDAIQSMSSTAIWLNSERLLPADEGQIIAKDRCCQFGQP